VFTSLHARVQTLIRNFLAASATYSVGQKSDTTRTYITLYERYHFFGPPCTLEYGRSGFLAVQLLAPRLFLACDLPCLTPLAMHGPPNVVQAIEVRRIGPQWSWWGFYSQSRQSCFKRVVWARQKPPPPQYYVFYMHFPFLLYALRTTL